jgi:hypothetical protein
MVEFENILEFGKIADIYFKTRKNQINWLENI